MITAQSIKSRFFREAFDKPLLDNTMRGLWCEFMIAEALGPECRAVGFGWHPWDLQIGPDSGTLPERIRIQVKNSAALQSWNATSGKLSRSSYNIGWRRRPAYFDRDFPDVPCEETGFLCDLFILCHHPAQAVETADHRAPEQWQFYLLPVTGPHCAVTEAEIAYMRRTLDITGRPSATQRQPLTLATGIHGRPPVPPVGIDALSLATIRASLGT